MRVIVRAEVLDSDQVAISDDSGKSITYRELSAEAGELTGCIEERSLIFFLCDHAMETTVFLYEVLLINAVPLLLSEDIGMDLLDHLMQVYKPQYLYCRRQHEASGYYPPQTELDMHLLLKTDDKQYEIHPDVALLLSTSGTTGSAKLVKLSYDNLYISAEQVCARMNIRSGQKGLSPLSISYVYGLMFCVWHWHCGATLLTTEESVLGRRFSEFYIREKADNFAATPYIYQMLHRTGFWDTEKLKSLHWAMSAGTQMSEEDQIRMVSLMKDKFWIMYGQTECACFISGMNFDERHIKAGSVGKLLKNMEASIDSATGELILRGRNVCMGYAEQAAQLADGDVNQGILRTGDRASMDEDGCIYLKGRLTRYVKVLGKRICLDEIEVYLERHIPDAEFACSGTDDHIVVCHTDVMEILREQVLTLLDRNLNIPKKFVSCMYLKTIPRNSAGKIRYGRLKEICSERKNIGNLHGFVRRRDI